VEEEPVDVEPAAEVEMTLVDSTPLTKPDPEAPTRVIVISTGDVRLLDVSMSVDALGSVWG
jgi:hypothetical protein